MTNLVLLALEPKIIYKDKNIATICLASIVIIIYLMTLDIISFIHLYVCHLSSIIILSSIIHLSSTYVYTS